MDELAEARIRLEGSLELMERATAALETATKALRGRETHGLSAAARLLDSANLGQARHRAQALLPTYPALQRVTQRLTRAEARFRERLERRAQRLQLSPGSPVELAERLEQEPPLFEDDERDWAGVGFALICVAAVVAALYARPSIERSALIAVFSVLTGVALSFSWKRTTAVVTRHRLLIGAEAIQLSSSTRTTFIRRGEAGSGTPFDYVIRQEEPGADAREVPLPPGFLPGFRPALRRCEFPPEESGFLD